MLNHLTITVSDYEKSVIFYSASLQVLGIKPLFIDPNGATGFGIDRPMFWIAKTDETHPVSSHVHIAFEAKSQEMVDAWHSATIAAGATDNGKPGFRPEYHKDYYAAFVLDSDGNNVEAVCGNS